MKKLMENKVVQAGIVSFLVISASILFYFILKNLGGILKILGIILDICKPVLIGFVLAYIMHPIVKLFDNKVFKGIKKDTVRRTLSITVTIILIFSLLIALISVIIPQLLESIETLIVNGETYVNNVQSLIKDFVKGSQAEKVILENFDKISDSLMKAANNILLPATEDAMSKIGAGVVGFGKVLFNIAVGMVFAIYILANTKNFSAGIRKTLYSMFNVERVNSFIGEVSHVNHVFGQFMLGKILGSSLVALITFTFLIIFGFPYPLLIAVIIGTTDLIPYFGPYIGSIPSALLIFMVSPAKALVFILFMVVLQQIDGNFTTPHIQKTVTGLPSFWVLFAITFFGGIFGVIGMIIGVPCLTIIYEIVIDSINRRLKKKNLPTDNEYYQNIDGVQERVVKSRILSKKKV